MATENLCTPKQAACLEKHGYDPNVTFDEARAILDELAANNWQRPDGKAPAKTHKAPARKPQSDGGCTAKQAAVLRKYGYDDGVSFDEASAIIDELAANGWKRPDADGDSY